MLIYLTALAAGILSWSFAEYALHCWIGHHGRGKNLFSREHLRHHGQKDYFSPVTKKALAAVPAISALAIGAGALLGPVGVVYALSFGLGYVLYECLHLRLHSHPPQNTLGRFLRRYHFYHHFHNPWKNQGVTSPLWDGVFGTRIMPEGPIQVPPRHALDWLLDETGEVKACYRQDYQLARR